MDLTKKKHEAKVFVDQVSIDIIQFLHFDSTWPENGPTYWSESNIFLLFRESKKKLNWKL